MSRSFRFTSNCLFFTILLVLSGCSGSRLSCDDLKVVASDEDVRIYLTEWVSENIEGTVISDQNLVAGGGRWPGFHSIDLDLEWQRLKISNGDGQIRIVGVLGDERDEVYARVNSVVFSDRSRYGILVKISDSDTFGIDARRIQVIDDNIAIICE